MYKRQDKTCLHLCVRVRVRVRVILYIQTDHLVNPELDEQLSNGLISNAINYSDKYIEGSNPQIKKIIDYTYIDRFHIW